MYDKNLSNTKMKLIWIQRYYPLFPRGYKKSVEFGKFFSVKMLTTYKKSVSHLSHNKIDYFKVWKTLKYFCE